MHKHTRVAERPCSHTCIREHTCIFVKCINIVQSIIKIDSRNRDYNSFGIKNLSDQ